MSPDRLYELLKRCGVQQIQDGGTNYRACCPYHNERQPSWGISKSDPHLYGCFACHARGSITKLLVDKLGVTYTKAAQLAETNLSIAPSQHLKLNEKTDNRDELEYASRMLDLLVPSPIAFRYLLRRRVSLATARRADIRFDYEDDRVVFPWYVDGTAVGATGRSLNREERAKTIPYAGMPKGDYLYFPRRPKLGRAFVLVEGEIDALRTAQALPEHNVAAIGFGVFTAKQQSLTLKYGPTKLITMFDHDETGERLTQIVKDRMNNLLRFYSADWYNVLPEFGLDPDDGKFDPGDVSDKVIQRLVDRPKSALSF